MYTSNLSPLITETSINNAKKNWYTFKAPVSETKDTLKKKIEETFKVNVIDIKTLISKGKAKRSAKSRKIKRDSNWKKVMVKLKEGQKINAFDLGGMQ